MTELPEPLIPKDCDLRDFHGTLIDRHRLRTSRFNSRANNDEWRAGVNLWLSASDEVPAGSLPDDDIDLCRCADLHRDMEAWLKVKAVAMHGWVKCNDGRWYHPVVCEKALEAWIEKLSRKRFSAAGNAKRYKTDFDPTEIDAAYSLSCEKLRVLNPNSNAFSKSGRVFSAGKLKHDKNSPAGSEQQDVNPPAGSEERNAEPPCGSDLHGENPPIGIPSVSREHPESIPQGSLYKGYLEGIPRRDKEEALSGKVEGDFPPDGDDDGGADEGGPNPDLDLDDDEGLDAKHGQAGQKPRYSRPKMAQELADYWNSTVGSVLGKVQKITAPRANRLHRILHDEFQGDPAELQRFVDRVGQSDFLTGGSPAGWKADFDWCLKPANFVKIVEGRYDNARSHTSNKPSASEMVVY